MDWIAFSQFMNSKAGEDLIGTLGLIALFAFLFLMNRRDRG